MTPSPRLSAESSVRLNGLRRRLSQHRNRHPTASLGQVMGAVLWGFFGVRKNKAMARDVRMIKPAQVIVVGIAFAAIFVFALILIVRLITRGL